MEKNPIRNHLESDHLYYYSYIAHLLFVTEGSFVAFVLLDEEDAALNLFS